jgi:hypothetical protein
MQSALFKEYVTVLQAQDPSGHPYDMGGVRGLFVAVPRQSIWFEASGAAASCRTVEARTRSGQHYHHRLTQNVHRGSRLPVCVFEYTEESYYSSRTGVKKISTTLHSVKLILKPLDSVLDSF